MPLSRYAAMTYDVGFGGVGSGKVGGRPTAARPGSVAYRLGMTLQVIRAWDEFREEWRRGAVSVGNFDGVHRGHARLASELVRLAGGVGGPSVVLTFDPHPVRLLRPDAVPPPLTWTDRKAQLLGELGVDVMFAYPTDTRLLELSPRDFYRQVLREGLDVRALAEGPNFRFGHGRQGDISLLSAWCEEDGVELSVVEPVECGGQPVSSSRVRELVRRGEVAEAARLLTRPYRVRGLVTHGAGRGAGLGFATANIDGIDTLLPALGVYAGRVRRADACHAAAVNVGANPTFAEHAVKFEVHLLDFHESLYGEVLEIDLLERLRDVVPFPSRDALVRQLHQDVARVRERVTLTDPAIEDNP